MCMCHFEHTLEEFNALSEKKMILMHLFFI